VRWARFNQSSGCQCTLSSPVLVSAEAPRFLDPAGRPPRRAAGWALRGLWPADSARQWEIEMRAIRRPLGPLQLELLCRERLLGQPCIEAAGPPGTAVPPRGGGRRAIGIAVFWLQLATETCSGPPKDDGNIQPLSVAWNKRDASADWSCWSAGGFSLGDYLRCGPLPASRPLLQESGGLAARVGADAGDCNRLSRCDELACYPGLDSQQAPLHFPLEARDAQCPTGRCAWLQGYRRGDESFI